MRVDWSLRCPYLSWIQCVYHAALCIEEDLQQHIGYLIRIVTKHLRDEKSLVEVVVLMSVMLFSEVKSLC